MGLTFSCSSAHTVDQQTESISGQQNISSLIISPVLLPFPHYFQDHYQNTIKNYVFVYLGFILTLILFNYIFSPFYDSPLMQGRVGMEFERLLARCPSLHLHGADIFFFML